MPQYFIGEGDRRTRRGDAMKYPNGYGYGYGYGNGDGRYPYRLVTR